MNGADCRAPAVSAHRGGGELAPEGTYEAYQGALAVGAEYVEFDVRRTSDGTLVAFHRAWAGWGRAVASVSYARLCALAGREVPRITDLARLLAGRAVGHLDLKEAGSAAPVVGQALELLGAAGVVVTTGDGAVAETASFTIQRLRTPGLSRLHRVLASGADWAVVHHRQARTAVLAECRARGIKTMVWTVNGDQALARWLARPDVDVLVTDRPARAIALRDRWGRAMECGLGSPGTPAPG